MPDLKSGFVAIVGRPNAGKSTLLNAFLKQKISIVSRVPQTTRHTIRGILNLKEAQIVFVDTPGLHLYKERLSSELNSVAKNSLKDTEVILYLVDCSRPPQREENNIMNMLTSVRTPLIMVLNKIDKSRKHINDYIQLWNHKTRSKASSLKYFIPASSLRGDNLDRVTAAILEFLPQGQPFYDQDTVTDFPLLYRAADLIREKICLILRQELPHSTAVEVEDMEEKDRFTHVRANILVARKSQKAIIIGEAGSTIKEIGSRARADLEDLLGRKVFLDLWVKVERHWQNKPRILRELGYSNI